MFEDNTIFQTSEFRQECFKSSREIKSMKELGTLLFSLALALVLK